MCYWIFNITPNFNNTIKTISVCSADVTFCRSSMWAETPKMWWCHFTTSTKWPISSLKSAHFKSFYINSWREHVSWRHTDFSSVAPKNNLMKYCIYSRRLFLSRLFSSVCYGSWFDHVKDWTSQTATMTNLLHITYEEMSLVKQCWIILLNINLNHIG